MRRAAIAAVALLLCAAGEPSRPSVMLMTGLPLVWGEKGPFDPASRPAAAYVALSRDFAFQPVDVLDSATLDRGRLLLLAQPQRLAPAELVALDAWIRRGGRALILTDPMLDWPSELPLGDIRRPPPAGLLDPLLLHWRLTMEAPAAPEEIEGRWDGKRVVMDSPGRFRSAGPDCVVDPGGWTAACRLGRGRVRLVADADLLRDSLWKRNDDAVGAWMDEMAGRPPRSDRAGIAALALGLFIAAAGLGLLLRRRFRR